MGTLTGFGALARSGKRALLRQAPASERQSAKLSTNQAAIAIGIGLDHDVDGPSSTTIIKNATTKASCSLNLENEDG